MKDSINTPSWAPAESTEQPSLRERMEAIWGRARAILSEVDFDVSAERSPQEFDRQTTAIEVALNTLEHLLWAKVNSLRKQVTREFVRIMAHIQPEEYIPDEDLGSSWV